MQGTRSSTPPYPEVTKNELVELLNLLTLLKLLELLHVHNAALQGHRNNKVIRVKFFHLIQQGHVGLFLRRARFLVRQRTINKSPNHAQRILTS